MFLLKLIFYIFVIIFVFAFILSLLLQRLLKRFRQQQQNFYNKTDIKQNSKITIEPKNHFDDTEESDYEEIH